MRISAKKGFITPYDIAEELKVTARAARDYLSDFTNMGLMFYEGAGRYVVNREALHDVVQESQTIGDSQLRIEDFMPEVLAKASRNNVFFKKALKIIKKLGYSLEKVDEIREALLKPGSTKGYEDLFVGDRLLYTRAQYDLMLKGLVNAKAVGEYSHSILSNYIIGGTFPLTVAYLTSCAVIAEFDHVGELASTRVKRKPEIKPFSGKEPYNDDELLYELSVEYPELLTLGRKIASRFLKEHYRYSNCIEILKDERELTIVVSKGSLLPHGFVLAKKCDVLKTLMKSMLESFKELIDLADKRSITLVAISKTPRDNRYFKAVRELLNLNLPSMSDYAFLYPLMRDGDATSPMRVPKERGKNVENWYEFYLKRGNYLYKLEYVTKRDPLEEQREILSILYPAFIVGGSLPMITEAERYCITHLSNLKLHFEAALRTALKYIPKEPMGLREARRV